MHGSMHIPWAPGGMAVAALSLVLAGCTIWCLLTDPLTMAAAIQSRDVTALASLIAGALTSAVEAILRWL
jgi:hypothetical protein